MTTHDATLRHARVSKEGPRLVMQCEADRMRNLRITDDDVAPERVVTLAERRSRIDGRPTARLVEQVDVTHNATTPHHRPSIGMGDAVALYRRHHAPGNAFAVVAGDVTVAEVRAMAEAAYGVVAGGEPRPANMSDLDAAPPPSLWPAPGRHGKASRRCCAGREPRCRQQARLCGAPPREAEVLELLAAILSNGKSSRMAKWLDAKDPLVVAARWRLSGRASP